MLFLLPLAVVLLLAAPLFPVWRSLITGKKARLTVLFHLCAFFGVMLLSFLLPVGGFAAQVAGEGLATAISTGKGLAYLAAAFSTGASAVGSGIAVASAAPAAIGATSEDPGSFGKALIFVVLGEGIAIYGLLISILILNNLG
jgi:V/A-type H+-transporting ATPase subunit K